MVDKVNLYTATDKIYVYGTYVSIIMSNNEITIGTLSTIREITRNCTNRIPIKVKIVLKITNNIITTLPLFKQIDI